MAKKKNEAAATEGQELATFEQMSETAVAILPYATPVGLNLPDDLSFELWTRYARIVKVSETGTPWWIGDLVNFAGDHGKEYTEHAVQKLHELGYADQTLINYGNIAKQFPLDRRRMELTIAHHKMVIGMPKKKADDLLTLAIAKNWTSREIQEYRREQEAKAAQTNGHVEKEPTKTKATSKAEAKQPEPEPEQEDEPREPDQAAKAGRSFPIDEDEWAEYTNLCSKVRTEVNILDGWMTDPQERAVAEQYKALANARDQIVEAMDQAEKFGVEPL